MSARKDSEQRPPTDTVRTTPRRGLAELVADGRLEEAAGVFREELSRLQKTQAHCETLHRQHHNLAVVLYRLGKFEEAWDHLNEALACREPGPKTHFLRGLMLADRGAMTEAVAAFSRALDLVGDWPLVLVHRGVAYFSLRDYGRARRDFEAARKSIPEDPVVLYDLALTEVMLGRWEEAQGLFRTLAELDPEDAAGYYELVAQSYRAQDQAETSGQIHRLKNMMGMVSDRLRLFRENVSNQLDRELRASLAELCQQYDLIYHDLAAFLNTVRREPLELDVADLHHLLDGALVAALSPQTAVEVVRDYDPELPDVVCDPQLVREAFLNVIRNAIEAMDNEGVLAITTGQAGEQLVYVIFVDTGPGVAPADRERIFQLGYSTKPFGSGIGLSQVRRALSIHGGRVEVTSGGPGATFTVYLPRRPRLEPALEDLRPKGQLPEDAGELIVEPADEGELLV